MKRITFGFVFSLLLAVAPSAHAALISSQEDSSGTPSHYWHSDGSTGAYIVTDPNAANAPGYSIGIVTATTTAVVGLHIKAQYDTDGTLSPLRQTAFLFDESNNTPYACAAQPYQGYSYPTAEDAAALQNPYSTGGYNNTMVDMYFNCYLGAGHDDVYGGTSYRLFIYPISTADVYDIYVAMNAAGTEPYYEISDDGGY